MHSPGFSDIDLQDQVLWVRDGKGKIDRLLPIPSQAVKVVSTYIEDSRPHLVHDPKEMAFFLTRSSRRMSSCLLEVIVREHGKAAGIPRRVHLHALRHGGATHLLKRGAEIRHIQELLGHSHITKTAAYTKVCVEDLKDVLSKKHPREKLYKGRKSVFFSSLKDRINP